MKKRKKKKNDDWVDSELVGREGGGKMMCEVEVYISGQKMTLLLLMLPLLLGLVIESST